MSRSSSLKANEKSGREYEEFCEEVDRPLPPSSSIADTLSKAGKKSKVFLRAIREAL